MFNLLSIKNHQKVQFNQILNLFVLFFTPLSIQAQIRVAPTFPLVTDNITVTYDAAILGNGGLSGVAPIYIYRGLITPASTSLSDWKYVNDVWPVNTASNTMTNASGSLHTVSYNISTFHNFPVGTNPTKLAMVFRNASGSQVGKTADNQDFFWDIWDGLTFDAKFLSPSNNINVAVGVPLSIECASTAAASMNLRIDGTLVAGGSGTTLNYNIAATQPGTHTLTFRATQSGTGTVVTKTMTYTATPTVTVENPPSGLKLGANENGDGTTTFLLRAPNKGFVYLLGSFNGWATTNANLMKRSTDGNTFWLTVSGLNAGTTYLYQYLVDGNTRVADPCSRTVLDPANDGFLTSTIYPNLPTYPTGNATGYVTIFEKGKTPYPWQVSSFSRPLKSDLVVYELLVRDFSDAKTLQGVISNIQHLKNLGINAIEIMPLHEFEGNDSWGYNTTFFMATDKAYGPSDKVREFVDICHQNGIAVILDVAYNHVFSTAPIAQMYWNAAGARPIPTSAYANEYSKHPFSVGYDLNHESTWTKEYTKEALRVWLDEYKFDGFRFDLSKGFTQNNTCDAVGQNCNQTNWSNYDQSRINILNEYYGYIQSVSPSAYMVCEHLGIQSEEKEMCRLGMMVWHKKQDNYKQAAMAFSSGSDLSVFSPETEDWAFPKYDAPLTYAESHDEERIMTETLANGNQVSGYSTRDLNTALRRQELMAAFFYTVPGAKMLWQFGELGFDYGINSFGGRTSAKPSGFTLLPNANRERLAKVVGNIISLRTRNPSVFRTPNHNPYDMNASAGQAWYHKHFHLSPTSGFKVTIVGNFDVVAQTLPAYFQNTGTWYDYLSGQTVNVTNANMTFNLQPGEYHIFIDQNIAPPNGFTPWSASPIPVELVSFEAKVSGKNDVLLNWKTATELNNSHYIVERSYDGQVFAEIGRVKGSGTSHVARSYQYLDKNLTNGTFYYRLRQVDFNGKEELSVMQSAKILGGKTSMIVYPNPSSDKIFIQNAPDTEGGVLTDLAGHVLLNLPKNANEVSLLNLANGVYFIKKGSENVKFVKN